MFTSSVLQWTLHGRQSVKYVFVIRVTVESGQAVDIAHLKDILFASKTLSIPLVFYIKTVFFLAAPHRLSAERLKSFKAAHSVQYLAEGSMNRRRY